MQMFWKVRSILEVYDSKILMVQSWRDDADAIWQMIKHLKLLISSVGRYYPWRGRGRLSVEGGHSFLKIFPDLQPET